MVSVPALLLVLSVHAALFLASVFSALRPLHPTFRFLVCFLAGSFSSSLLPRSDLSSLCDGVALWDESVDSVGSFAFFSGAFSRPLYTTGWFRCRSLPLFSSSSFLDFCGFFFPSSHLCCVWACSFSRLCAPWFVVLLYAILFSTFVCFALILSVYCTVSMSLGAILFGFSLVSLLVFLS